MFLANPRGSGLAPDAPKPKGQRTPGLKAMTAVPLLLGGDLRGFTAPARGEDALEPERADLWL